MNASKRNVDPEQIIEDLSASLLSWYHFDRSGAVLYVSGKEDLLYKNLQRQGHFVVCASMKESTSEVFLQKYRGHFAYLIAVEWLEMEKDPVGALNVWRKLLKPEGCLLLGMHNRLGTCYFCGERDPYTGRNFDGIENYRRILPSDWKQIKGRGYARNQIEGMLREGGFPSSQFFSILPGLMNPQMVISEGYIPKEELARRIFPTYSYPGTVFLDEEYLYTGLIQNGLFHAMANAYLIECPMDGKLSDVKQVTLSVDRGPNLALATILKEKTVEKRALYPQGQAQLEKLVENVKGLEERGLSTIPLKLQENTCVMPYVEGISGQLYLHELAYEDKEKFIRKMDAFRDMVLASSEVQMLPVQVSKLLDGKQEIGEDGSVQDDLGLQSCLKKGYIDLVPLNTIYKDGTFWILDQEFVEEDLPAAVVLTRLVDLVYEGDSRLESIIPESFFLERYHLTEHLNIWRRKAGAFTAELRNERELRRFLETFRRNAGVVNSNRQRMNYSQKEYMRLFINIFDGLDRKKLYLFGSGLFARQFLAYYHKKYPVEAILDNNQEKWGEELEQIPICSPDMLIKQKPGSFKVIICIKNYIGVMKQLDAMGTTDYSIYDSSMEYPSIVQNRNSAETQPVKEENRADKPYHVGYIAGVFDLFHIGHLNLLKRAKEQCDHLIVGVVTDEGVRRNKKTNPFIPFEERLEIVRSCRYVDEAVEIPLDFPSTKDAYRMYHFDVQFSGSDYENDPDWLAEQQFLEREGAEMVFFPYTKSTSSTKLKQLISEQIICQNKGCNPETDSM